MSHHPSSGRRAYGSRHATAAGAIFVAIVLLSLLLCTPAFAFLGAGPQWYWLNPTPQGSTIQDVAFVDGVYGWAVCHDGSILATSDGGVTWVQQSVSTPAMLNGVSFPTRKCGWAVGSDGVILRTTDGGKHWTKLESGTTKMLNSVSFATTLAGWAVGDDGLILATQDGGTTWQEQTSPSSDILNGVTSVSASQAWAAGKGGRLLRTTDGGQHWLMSYCDGSSSYWFQSIDFVDGSNGWAADSFYGAVAKTTDGGETWDEVSPPSSSSLNAIVATTERVWTVGAGGVIFSRPTEASGTWVTQTSGTVSGLNAIAATGTGGLFVAGERGVMLSSGDSGVTWMPRSSGFSARLSNVTFFDALHGWAVGQHQTASTPVIYGTADGGRSWTLQYECANPYGEHAPYWIGDVAFADATHGFAVGWGGGILGTTDGGSVWNAQVVAGSGKCNYEAVTCTSSQDAWAVGNPMSEGVNMRSTHDGGASWLPVDAHTSVQLNDIAFAGTQRGWAVGGGGAIVTSADGGVTWSAQTSNVTLELLGVDFVDELRGWIVGRDGTILVTSDGGANWTPQVSGSDGILSGVAFADASVGWVFDEFGDILTTSDGGATWSSSGARADNLMGGFCLDKSHAWAVGHGGATVALDVIPPALRAKWPKKVQHKPVKVKFRASDGQSGVAMIQYKVGTKAWKTGTSVKIKRNGRTKVRYRAYDIAGNVTRTKSLVVRIRR